MLKSMHFRNIKAEVRRNQQTRHLILLFRPDSQRTNHASTYLYWHNANGPQTFGLGWTLVFIRQCWSIKWRCTKKNIYTGTMCEYLVYVFRKRLPHCLAGGISYFSLREMNPLLRDIKRSNIGETLLRSGASIAMQYTDIQLPTDSQWKRIPVLPKEQALVNWKHHERA